MVYQKPIAKAVIPKFQPRKKLLREKKLSKKYKAPLTMYPLRLKIKKNIYLGLNIIIRFTFTTNLDRYELLIVDVSSSLTREFEP